MIIRYSANTLPGQLLLPTNYVDMCTPEDLAELATSAHWQDHPEDTPTMITVVHMKDVDGRDLGLFEVRCEQRLVFTACQLRQA
ncbi:hypothetical protein GIW54_01100 [Pseudomonas proteolytica]|uniref:Uncharacterized protein n=1 Tax=Pseudomonas proteolytica TaxID=219574 RepID=A0AAW5A9A6_9PSED|nr:hypothetical protein [Pseudomonas proteolytica]MCF5059150.1 hypothetical protein [Pseudomonas proteolytica]MCF5099359.1 hypothetical protein [Pseudomonas proteolytica]